MNPRRSLTAAIFVATMLAAAATTTAASATEPTANGIAVGEVAESSSGVDVAALRETAEGEVRQIDTSKISLKRRYVVSFSVARSVVSDAISCTASAILRDAKTGAMIAVIEGGAQAAGSSSDEVARRVVHAAVRSAMRRIPTALATK